MCRFWLNNEHGTMESAVEINSTLGRQGFNNTKLGHLQCYCVEILIKVQLGRISVAQMHYIHSHARTFNISNRYSSVTTTTYYKLYITRLGVIIKKRLVYCAVPTEF
jgi:hypothetical protein